MQNKYIKQQTAYSFAETLITMLVVIMIVMMSAPMLTGKKKAGSKPHGVWECTLVNGSHVSKKTMDDGTVTTKDEGEYCTFESQPSTDKYSVTVVGAGGGGASGATAVNDAISYGNTVGYEVDVPGEYAILIIGGGGGGSAKMGTKGNYGGSAGYIWVSDSYTLSKGYYILKAGMGGKAGGEEAAGTSTDNLTSCQYTGSSSSWSDICNGGDGEESTFQTVNGGNVLKARGGYGGGEKANSNTGSGVAYKDTERCSSRASGYSIGGKIFSSTAQDCQKARTILGTNASQYAVFGHGGDGGFPGYNGIVIVQSSAFYAGGGGKPGSVAYMTLNAFKDPIKVYVGAGGEGATVENARGLAGQNSSFGNYLTAKGGDGGEIKALSSTSKTSGLGGEAGAQSPYGGILAGGSGVCNETQINGTNNMNTNSGYADATDTTYGGGGGGGGAFSHRNTNCSLTNKWGKGGRGAPGYVRVEWN